MSTAAQFAANLANAQLSTGPVTAEGKRTSSRNALRHGLYSKSPIIPGESAADFEALRDEIIEEFRPAGIEATLLCEQLIDSIWRARRIERLETAWFAKNPDPDLSDPKVFRVWAEFGRQHARCERVMQFALKRLMQMWPPRLASFSHPEPAESPVADPRTLGRPKPKLALPLATDLPGSDTSCPSRTAMSPAL